MRQPFQTLNNNTSHRESGQPPGSNFENLMIFGVKNS
jgi:hypothetical protein